MTLSLKEVDAAEATRLRSIWTYWEGAVTDEVVAGGEGDDEAEDEEPGPAVGVDDQELLAPM